MKKIIFILTALFTLTIYSQQSVNIKKINSDLYEIKVEINNTVKLPFLLDTGASEISIPPSVARVLVISKTLSYKDTLQGRYYSYANGEYSYCKRFMIRKLKLGNIVLYNVPCVVSDNDRGSLLLGQSVLRRFKKYKIDNVKNIIIFYK